MEAAQGKVTFSLNELEKVFGFIGDGEDVVEEGFGICEGVSRAHG